MISGNEEKVIPKEEPLSEHQNQGDNSDDEQDEVQVEHPPSFFYALVGNIPPHFRSSELRNYFSATAEADKVHCFHFRHRPQIERAPNDNLEQSSSKSKRKSSLCAIVRFSEEFHQSDFVQKYHGKFWMDKTGNEIHGRCIAQKVRLSSQELVKFRKELVPPRFMPKGNVGTKNSYFLNLIKECVLPASLIKKLNLEFPRGRSFKKYSKVPFDYETGFSRRFRGRADVTGEEYENIYTAKGHLISSTSTEPSTPSTSGSQNQLGKSPQSPTPDHIGSENESDPNEDEDLCEEWERHEALNNDVTSQERSKERLYEEEIELVWEKGGPGIVWYTDAQYWDAQRGSFDERTADDLDVDMEGYYTPGGGDKDARDMLEMRQSERFRNGEDGDFSVFKRPTPKQDRPQGRLRHSPSPSTSASSSFHGRHSKKTKIGEFERHTRGFGRKLMEKQGWKDGVGLGTSKNEGIPEALEGDGQAPRDKRGFGYYGEKLEWGSKSKRPKHSHSSNPFGLDEDDRVVIGTIYDKPKELDREEPLLRSNAPTFIKRY